MKRTCFVAATLAFVALIALIINHSVLLFSGPWSKHFELLSDIGSLAAGLSNIVIAYFAFKAIPSFTRDREAQSKYELKLKIKKTSYNLIQNMKHGYSVFYGVRPYLMPHDSPAFQSSFFQRHYTDHQKNAHIEQCSIRAKEISISEEYLVNSLTDYEIEFDKDFWQLKQEIHALSGLISDQLKWLSEMIGVSIEPKGFSNENLNSFEVLQKAKQVTRNYEFLFNEHYFTSDTDLLKKEEDPLLTLICDLEETCKKIANGIT
jgi:hypothetical protein